MFSLSILMQLNRSLKYCDLLKLHVASGGPKLVKMEGPNRKKKKNFERVKLKKLKN
jgi:hypothetical protein